MNGKEYTILKIEEIEKLIDETPLSDLDTLKELVKKKEALEWSLTQEFNQ